MKSISAALEKYRNRKVALALYGSEGDEYNGLFTNVPLPSGAKATIIASNGGGWEHVSVSIKGRCPRWQEMCYVKDLIFDNEEEVVQFHPKKSEYVNIHDTCLHLWRPTNGNIMTPPKIYV